VQIVDVAPHYGLLSVQGPRAEEVVLAIGLIGRDALPRVRADQQLGPTFVKISDATLGEIYLMNRARLSTGRSGGNEAQISDTSETPHVVSYNSGFDLLVPNSSLAAVADKLIAAAKQIGGRAAGWQAFETTRIEAGIPRFGMDMDETNIPLECGPALRDAISYHKGCYIGQEVINRIHSVGHVTRELRGLQLAGPASAGLPLPQHGDKLFHNGREIGHVTSAVKSPVLNATIALSYVRREANQIGTELTLRTAAGEYPVQIVELPFVV
jgi:folate-binding protein YgfZ